MSNLNKILQKMELSDPVFVSEIRNELEILQKVREQFRNENSIDNYEECLETSTIKDLEINSRIMKRFPEEISLIPALLKESKFILQLNSLVNYSEEFQQKSILRTQAVLNCEIFTAGLESNKLPLEEIEGLFGLKVLSLQSHVFNVWKIIYNFLGKENFANILSLSLQSGSVDEMFMELLVELGNFKVEHPSVIFLTTDEQANNILWEYDYIPKM